MEELNLTPEELKIIIDDGKMIGHGFFGMTFKYGDRLIKLDKQLYSLLKYNNNEFADEMFNHRYKWEKENFTNPRQIEVLASKQKDITLTKLPQGVVNVKGIIPGIIIPYHEDHKALELLPKEDYITLLKILKKLLLEVKELADHEISQEDLVHYYNKARKNKRYNILYKDDVPQIIDLDGELITCGENFKSAKGMYQELGNVILGYFEANNLPTDTKSDIITDEKKAQDLIEELDFRLKGK